MVNAGIGIDVGVNGLDKLIHTNDEVKKFSDMAEKMSNFTMNLTPQIQNNDEFSKFYRRVRKLQQSSMSSTPVHFEATGTETLNQKIHDFRKEIHKNIDLQLVDVDPIHHEMEYINKPAHKDVKFDIDSGAIDEMRNTIHHVNNSVGHFKNRLTATGRTGESSFRNIGDDAEHARDKTESLANSGKHIHGIFSATFIGNAASNAFSALSNHAESAIKSGMKLVQTGDEVKESWEHIGVGNGNADAMFEQMDKMRDSAGMDEKTIQQLQRRFYVFTGSASRARSLTDEIVSFGKASGESSQQIGRMGQSLPRLLSSSKVRASMLNRTLGQDPGLFKAIVKSSGHTQSSFQQLVNSGKLTSQQLQQWMTKAAHGSSHAMNEYYHTFGGQMQAIRGTWTAAQENFSRPFVSNLTRAVNSTTKSAGGLKNIQKSVGQLSNTLGKKVGNFVGKAVGFLVKNQKPLIKIGTALGRIVKQMAEGVWKSFASMLELIGGHAYAGSSALSGVSSALTAISKHTTAMRNLGRILAVTFMVSKLRKFKVALFSVSKTMNGTSNKVGILRKSIHALINPQETLNKLQSKWQVLQKAWLAIIGPIKAFWTAEKAGVGIQTALNVAMDANPVGAIVLAVTAAVGVITGLVIGLHHLYTHCAPARHAMQDIGKVGVGAFKAITFPARMVIKLLGGITKGVWDATSGLRHKLSGAFDNVKGHAEKFYNSALHNSDKWGHEFGSWVTGNGGRYRHNQSANSRAVKASHRAIDSYRKNSSGKFRAYISKNGKIYRSYHRGATRISETTYKQREALRSRYYKRYESSLRKYENNYRKYESKRSSLSRKYGKLRAMYSEKSLKQVESRFKSLRSTITKYTKQMYNNTQHWFKRLGTGAIKQYRVIYNAVRKYLRMSNREAVKDFKTLSGDSRKYLDGAVKRYVGELRYRFSKQRYYDNQLVKQATKTNQSMYKIPLGWISKETRMLVNNWKQQRDSFITHNERMTHAEVTHISTVTDHINEFSDNFKKTMNDMEDSIYDAWTKFWDKMHNAAGSGINAVQSPLNSGAEHINSFVRAFGEDTSPMHSMPSVSYATGTGLRRPITQMTDAVLNDGMDSPETNHQETVIHPNGNIEFPRGQNIHKMLEPGTEVLNATETKLMSQMAHFAPTVHFSSGTGIFGSLFAKMDDWIKSALENNNHGMDYNSIYDQAKGSGAHKLLHVLQKVLSHSTQVLSGFMGNAPSGYHRALDDIIKGIYGQTSSQINGWWKALMNLTNQTLNQGGATGPVLQYAEKFGQGKKYVWGGTGSGGGYDCSGFVQAVLRHFGVNAPRTSGPQINAYPHISRSEAKPGDLVGNSGHIGIVADNGAHHYYSMFNPSVGAKLYPLDSQHWDGNPTMTFARVPKLAHQGDNNEPSFKGANKGLMNFVKNQEKPYFKWIEKHLVPLMNPDPGGGPGVAKWRSVIKQAADKMHVNLTNTGLNKVLSNIQHESGGDEAVTQKVSDINSAQGDPAIGLVQFIPRTFKSYAVSGHDNIRSGYDQLLALFNDSNWFSDIAPGGGWGPTGHRKMAVGGHINPDEVATVGEKGEELFKPDVPGTVIPHEASKKILNNNNSKHPVNYSPHYTFKISGDNSKQIAKQIDKRIEHSNNNLMDKLNRMAGVDKDRILY